MKNFITRKWLKENINNEDLIILDARADLIDDEKGFELYKEGHIAGAQFVSLKDVMTGEIGIHGGRHPLPDMDIFVKDMMGLGIQDDSMVVIYDDGDLSMAGRLWWLLKYMAKDKVYVLEGGYNKWVKMGEEITKVIKENKEAKSLSLNINKDIKVDMEYVRNALNKKEVAIIDARSYERYIGRVEPLDKIPGHIPSAMNLPWESLIEEDGMNVERISKDLAVFQKYQELIVYCGSGISGTVPFICMDEIGLKVKLYPGSYSDWISYDDNPVVLGESP